jgi:hypothetical protein
MNNINAQLKINQSKPKTMSPHSDNFAETLFRIQERYNRMYPGEPAEAEGRLFNNILGFMNNNQSALSGYTPKFVEFINRGEPDKIRHIDSYIRKLNDITCEAAILEMWNKMLPDERVKFIGICYRKAGEDEY